tara:strand:+ start:1697 stop:1957 length:261 start_codon:yes stop_codon:yes gene_type:complete
MSKQATFSNGQTIVYKGKRPVTAAWMLTKSGEACVNEVVTTGFSRDLQAATKTAKSNLNWEKRCWSANSKRSNGQQFIYRIETVAI